VKRNVKLALIILTILVILYFVSGGSFIVFGIASLLLIPIFVYKNLNKLRSERNPLGSFGSPDNWRGHNEDNEYENDEDNEYENDEDNEYENDDEYKRDDRY